MPFCAFFKQFNDKAKNFDYFALAIALVRVIPSKSRLIGRR
ncbi:hypothetical protein CAMRE0001_2790 [Campylobacter rectus RM3267]|uniref:Uncharacterized protein n=1 Tax=Campylobacter rectus RM3267 TaxID=553218 RepID=B9D0Y4_CAMRE|nr:hypothetical protein CAMRE0001_2790 [Campylobacter rectus RM3267]